MTEDLDPELSFVEETVQSSLDGARHEIDLSAEHAGELRDFLAVYVSLARKTGGDGPVRRATRTSAAPHTSTVASSPAAASAVDTKAVREWGRTHGKPVNERGRIASSLPIEFQQAHHN